MNADDLRRLIAQVGELRGWDWSHLRMDRDPVPWHYPDIVRKYLAPSSYVLDVGTGGGEGGRNARSIFDAFGWGANEEHWQRFFAERGMNFKMQQVQTLLRLLPDAGCTVIGHGEYDVPTYFPDEQALVFYPLWSPLPENLDPERHQAQEVMLRRLPPTA